MNNNFKIKSVLEKKNLFSSNLIGLVESKYKRENSGKENELQVGDIVKIAYLIPEGNKERTQYYEGLVIVKKNKGLGKSFTIRRNVQGIGVEQVFLFHSPKITSIVKKQSSKVRRAKLYFIRSLRGKATRLKAKL